MWEDNPRVTCEELCGPQGGGLCCAPWLPKIMEVFPFSSNYLERDLHTRRVGSPVMKWFHTRAGGSGVMYPQKICEKYVVII